MIFVDTGAFIARYVKRDQHHREASHGWAQLRRRKPMLYTSNFVLDETFTLLARRTDYEFAAHKARSLLTSRLLRIVRPEHEDELQAVGLFEKYADQEVSFTDCVSFVLMRRHGLKHAFAFDRHFQVAGFEPWPTRRGGSPKGRR
ncbi:MAG: type II toxin-antitoxin system VapC family toxin [Polyangiales bacterium]